MLTIKLVRHGQSLANVGEVRGQDVGDQNIALTPLGHQQARDAGGTHGLAIRCFVMRFFHLTVEQFESMMNPKNCDVITIGARHAVSEPVFMNGRPIGSLIAPPNSRPS